MNQSNIVDLDRERRIQADFNRLGELLAGSANTLERTHQFLQGSLPMIKAEAETVILSIRMAPSTLTQLNTLTAKMDSDSTFKATLPGKVTRATVVRECLAIGMAALKKTQSYK